VLAGLPEPEPARAQVRALAADYGACTVGPPVGGDGTSRSVVRLTCARGDALLAMDAAGAAGRVTALRIMPAPGGRCVP
jgi:hypothetical protein